MTALERSSAPSSSAGTGGSSARFSLPTTLPATPPLQSPAYVCEPWRPHPNHVRLHAGDSYAGSIWRRVGRAR
jgi:hypothetical protein